MTIHIIIIAKILKSVSSFNVNNKIPITRLVESKVILKWNEMYLATGWYINIFSVAHFMKEIVACAFLYIFYLWKIKLGKSLNIIFVDL